MRGGGRSPRVLYWQPSWSTPPGGEDTVLFPEFTFTLLSRLSSGSSAISLIRPGLSLPSTRYLFQFLPPRPPKHNNKHELIIRHYLYFLSYFSLPAVNIS